LDARSGENLGEFTMKQPKMSNLKIDQAGTQKMRKKMASAKKVKITINFDSDILLELKDLAGKSGIPYQTLINRMVREAINQKADELSRLDKLEEEVKKLKAKLAA
jgi:predicted DNA binding CopG/RHH family protein